jgi:phenylacetate-CoA ligase
MTLSSHPDRNAIETEQLAKLRLLLHVLRSNPFYSAKLRRADIPPEFLSLEAFSKHMPFTLKQELIDDQQRNPPFGTNLTYPLDRYTRFTQTSASTGQPVRWLDTKGSWDWMLDNWIRVFEAAEVKANDRIFFPFSFAPFLGFWTAFEAAVRMGCLCIPGGGLTSVARLRLILDNNITVLCCVPTYAIRLAEVAAAENMDLAAGSITKIIVSGEAGGSISSTRSRIEKLWHGARVVDHHGMTEIGPVSYGCPKCPNVLHIIESAFIAEVIDPTSGEPILPGQAGELVLTNLGRLGSPLLRYRTGDLVQTKPEQPCECGSYELPLEAGILGRTDDMVVVRGVNLYPSAVEGVVRAYDDVAEYRVELHEQSEYPEIEVQIEATQNCIDPMRLAERLEAALQTTFALRIPVSIVSSGVLPRFEMKAQRWVRL